MNEAVIRQTAAGQAGSRLAPGVVKAILPVKTFRKAEGDLRPLREKRSQ